MVLGVPLLVNPKRRYSLAEPADLGAFGDALADALSRLGWTQRTLADALGMSQSAVSHWKAGTSEPLPRTVFAVEETLGLPPGELSRHLGYLPAGDVPAATVEAAIAGDARLSPQHRRVLLATHRELITP